MGGHVGNTRKWVTHSCTREIGCWSWKILKTCMHWNAFVPQKWFFCSWLHDRSLKKFRYERHSFRICYIASCLACNSNWSLTKWINCNSFNYWHIVLNQLYLFTRRKILIFRFSTIQSPFCSGHLLCAIKERPGHIYLAFDVLFHFFQNSLRPQPSKDTGCLEVNIFLFHYLNFITIAANFLIWMASLQLSVRVHNTLLAAMCCTIPFSARALQKHSLKLILW